MYIDNTNVCKMFKKIISFLSVVRPLLDFKIVRAFDITQPLKENIAIVTRKHIEAVFSN